MENYQVKSFDIFPYVKDKHDNVWKYIPAKDHFIKISPWKDGEDRRVNRFQIEQKINKGELEQYSNKQGIKQIINERWDKEDREWDFNGDHFIVSPRMNDNDFYKAKVHKFIHTYKCDGNPLPSFEGEPKLVAIPDNMDEFAELLWNSLNEDNKVSLFVRYIDIETGKYESKIINKNK